MLYGSDKKIKGDRWGLVSQPILSLAMQPVDFTTLTAVAAELRQRWLPARCEGVVQRDTTTVLLALRTLEQRGWLALSWHPQAARIHLDDAPPKGPETFTFGQQLKHQLSGLALGAIAPIAPWERVLDLQFSRRPGDPVLWHLYLEVMGKYSNVILVNDRGQIITAAHQVSAQQSSLRPIQTGDPYQFPPSLQGPVPHWGEPLSRWQERVALIPAPLKKALLTAYAGLSSALVVSLIQRAGLDPQQATTTLEDRDWAQLFDQWQGWLTALEQHQFAPHTTPQGYCLLSPAPQTGQDPIPTVNELLRDYYGPALHRQRFDRLHHQLSQVLTSRLKKLRQKRDDFRDRLNQADQAERYRAQADLLMAYSHQWQPGMRAITLADFATGEPVTIALEPDKTAIQVAQGLYKKHQKLKRSRQAIIPLLESVSQEVEYLEQVESTLAQTSTYQGPGDLATLEDIREELIQQGYLTDTSYRPRPAPPGDDSALRKITLPSGAQVWIGRNNRQNDLIISRLATDYDLWFHTQEIPGSHVLLRLDPGTVPSDAELQQVADLAAYYSRATQADQVPVVYTSPRHVYKPKGARPGMVIYRQERILWGQPQRALTDAGSPRHSAPV